MKDTLLRRLKSDRLVKKFKSRIQNTSLVRVSQAFIALFIVGFLVYEHSETVKLLVLGLVSISASYTSKFLQLGRVGFELTTFTTIVAAALYSPLTAGIFGASLIITHFLITGAVGPFVIWVVPSYFGLPYVIDFLGYGLQSSATFAVVAMHGLFITLTALIISENLARFVPYSLGNAVFNILLINSLLMIVVNLV